MNESLYPERVSSTGRRNTHKNINKLEKRCFQQNVTMELKFFTLKIYNGFRFLQVKPFNE